jgi:hypothetical protein
VRKTSEPCDQSAARDHRQAVRAGIITYEYGYYELNPRDLGDVGGITHTSGSAPVNNYPVVTISGATAHDASDTTNTSVGRCRLNR